MRGLVWCTGGKLLQQLHIPNGPYVEVVNIISHHPVDVGYNIHSSSEDARYQRSPACRKHAIDSKIMVNKLGDY